MGPRVTMLLVPFAVLGVSRVGADISVRLFPMHSAWISAFVVYYLAIEAAVFWVRRTVPAAASGVSFHSDSKPSVRLLLFGVLLPALLPAGFFVLNVSMVPLAVLGGIVLFAAINSYFEELFWRGLMAHLPAPDWVRILYSGALFSFSHWFFTGAYWLSKPRVLIPVIITTFVMGVAWMWFYLRHRNLLYTIASHFVVDVLNLSIAMFLGLRLSTV